MISSAAPSIGGQLHLPKRIDGPVHMANRVVGISQDGARTVSNQLNQSFSNQHPGGDDTEYSAPFGLSAIVPLYNEEDNVVKVYEELSAVLKDLQHRLSLQSSGSGETSPQQASAFDYEMIFVDDGSRDETVQRLVAISASDPHVRIVEFRRNFGQTAAMAAGLDQARFSMVATLDGDLQNDPRELPKMVEKLFEGFDLVAGWRKDRKDAFVTRKFPSMLANWLISKSTRVRLHDYGCTLKLMTYDIAKGIKLYGEMHRFIPALADEMGARIAEVPVNHRARQFGTSKYGISRTFRVILDLVTVKFLLSYSKRPIHLFGSIGLGSATIGLGMLAIMLYQRTFLDIPMGNRPLLALSIMMVIIGLQFLVFGLLGEVLARTYYESQGKKVYMIRRIHQVLGRTPPEGLEPTSNPGGDTRFRKVAN